MPAINLRSRLGGDIEVTVVKVGGDQVRIGMTKPLGMVIDRKERWLEKATGSREEAKPQFCRARRSADRAAFGLWQCQERITLGTLDAV